MIIVSALESIQVSRCREQRRMEEARVGQGLGNPISAQEKGKTAILDLKRCHSERLSDYWRMPFRAYG
jgi:hypothetical protein